MESEETLPGRMFAAYITKIRDNPPLGSIQSRLPNFMAGTPPQDT